MERPVQIVIASGTKEPKRLVLGLSMAAAAAAAGSSVRVFLTMDGVECLLPQNCRVELVKGYPPAVELLAAVRDAGGIVEYCPHCLPQGCAVNMARAADPSDCGCAGVPAGIASYGVRLSDHHTIVF